MSITPYFKIMNTCYGRRVLPQIEMISPLGRLREGLINNLNLNFEVLYEISFGIKIQFSFINTGFGIIWNAESEPYRASRFSFYIEVIYIIEHICRKRSCKIFRFAVTTTTGKLIRH